MAAMAVPGMIVAAAPNGGTAGGLPLGTELLFRYNTMPVEDHGRIIVGHVDAEEYIMVTPDADQWIENAVPDAVDVSQVWIRPAGGGMPAAHPLDGALSHARC